MQLLVLGGTAFLGHQVARSAVQRGHTVTCAARGSAPVPDGVTLVRLDRDRDDGLSPLAGTEWDAVIDVARHPGHVRRAVRDLRTRHWVYVSSISAYADLATPGAHESTTLLEPLRGDELTDLADYGRAKVACEDHLRAAHASVTIARSGLIGGPGDWSARSGYYPWRFAHPTGDRVLVPDAPDAPCSILDVRDLADWLVTAAQERPPGAFNAAGPVFPLAQVLDTARRSVGSTAIARPVPAARLRDLGVRSWMGPRSLPLWIDEDDSMGMMAFDNSLATRAGLRFRPLEQTLRDAAHFEASRTERPAGLTDDEEREILSAV